MKLAALSSSIFALCLVTYVAAQPTESRDEARRTRKRAENSERRGRSGVHVSDRQSLRKLRKHQNSVSGDRKESATSGVVELDPDSLVTMIPMEPVTEYNKTMTTIIHKRRRMLRLFQIQQQILAELGLPYQPFINISKGEHDNITKFYEPMINSGSFHLQEDQELYALMSSCKSPKNAHRATWEEEGTDLRLFFPVNSTAHKFRKTKVHSAILRLYKPADMDEDSDNSTDVTTETPVEVTTSLTDPSQEDRTVLVRPLVVRPRLVRQLNRQQHSTTPIPESEEEGEKESAGEEEGVEDNAEEIDVTLLAAYSEDSYNVTVYQYNRALRKNKKEKLEVLASVLVAKNHTGWVKIPVKEAAHLWMINPKKNFGLKVTVEDSDGRRVIARDIFQTTNCSLDANESTNTQYALAGAFDVDESNMTEPEAIFPTLDIVTVNAEPEESESGPMIPFRITSARVVRQPRSLDTVTRERDAVSREVRRLVRSIRTLRRLAASRSGSGAGVEASRESHRA